MQYAFDFAFDKVTEELCKTTDNHTVYQNTVSFLIDGVIDGFNATVFAYGATGCGKTFTYFWNNEEWLALHRNQASCQNACLIFFQEPKRKG